MNFDHGKLLIQPAVQCFSINIKHHRNSEELNTDQLIGVKSYSIIKTVYTDTNRREGSIFSSRKKSKCQCKQKHQQSKEKYALKFQISEISNFSFQKKNAVIVLYASARVMPMTHLSNLNQHEQVDTLKV